MRPYYSDDLVTIWHGDCREWIPAFDCIVTDPPYGIAYYPPRTPRSRSRNVITGDAAPFDPSWMLTYRAAMFGANYYSDRLPVGGWIIWNKRVNGNRKAQYDAELCWTNMTKEVRLINKPWNGGGTLYRENGKATALHDAQKPVDVMREVLQLVGARAPILDPYMGSGSTLVAAKSLGLASIGIEIEERYCEIAARRCSQEVLGLSA
jgi:DNA modification methylase